MTYIFRSEYLPIILVTLVGFGLLAAALLIPVYRFMEREQEVSKQWTPEELARRAREQQAADDSPNGTAHDASDAPSPTPNQP